ncbi:hypothetical protein [Cylindrospermopsis raciborskii]|uniref:hypothetical protein n=1 Tax=Cylindrospermopsis raciborskii TaxID=77022 RepID=UPI0022C7C4BB|nr:hypothetical protein [Cylindrospermopsis raciborskii]MCZ2207863.1 hypothetical protein [Cylindrospermopsis raciborskii PAMP2011]
MSGYKTEQESFWAEKFGDDYIERNSGDLCLARNIALFSRILSRTQGVNSLVEFGANIGLNLQAVRQLLPHIELSAIEINESAASKLRSLPGGGESISSIYIGLSTTKQK